MTFNGFGTQATWPDGTGISAPNGENVSGRTSIRDLCHGMNNCVSKRTEKNFAQAPAICLFVSLSFGLQSVLLTF